MFSTNYIKNIKDNGQTYQTDIDLFVNNLLLDITANETNLILKNQSVVDQFGNQDLGKVLNNTNNKVLIEFQHNQESSLNYDFQLSTSNGHSLVRRVYYIFATMLAGAVNKDSLKQIRLDLENALTENKITQGSPGSQTYTTLKMSVPTDSTEATFRTYESDLSINEIIKGTQRLTDFFEDSGNLNYVTASFQVLLKINRIN